MLPSLLILLVLQAGPQGLPALHDAARRGALPEVAALLAGSPKRDLKDAREWTALHWAAIAGREEVAAALLDAGENPNARGQYDLTPLHWASLADRPALVALLVRRGANVAARDVYGMTPLHLAASPKVMRALLDVGADLAAADDLGMTPLHWARNQDVALAMLAAKADIRLRSVEGRTPLEYTMSDAFQAHGLLALTPRPSARLKGEAGRMEVWLRSVSENPLQDLVLEVSSQGCTAKPATLSRLEPGERVRVAFDLARNGEVKDGEWKLALSIRAGGAALGRAELTLDSSRGDTLEDRGAIRLGTATVRQDPGRWVWALYGLAPLLVLGLWWMRRRATPKPPPAP